MFHFPSRHRIAHLITQLYTAHIRSSLHITVFHLYLGLTHDAHSFPLLYVYYWNVHITILSFA